MTPIKATPSQARRLERNAEKANRDNLEKCVNCGEKVWLGVFFGRHFLCSACLTRAGEIIYELKQKLRKAKL